jgi:two-component system response regulator AtoC
MKVLVVEDETAFRQVLENQFAKDEIEATGVGTGKEALEALAKGDFDVVVTDLRLPDIDGIEIIRQTRNGGNEVPFLLMTAYASVKTAVSALQTGAADYLVKPVRVPDLVRRVKQIYDLDRLKRENTLLRRIVQHETKKYWLPDTAASQNIKQLIAKVSNTDLTVLICGESGTGKGMTARLIHATSDRADKPFVAVNCGAIPENLVESELFGHVKGAFTGADKNQDGLFVAATGGTLFLDEIGELPPAVQVKLLNAIEEKAVRPVGATRDRVVNVRIIAATNRNLEKMVEEGTFRRDLFYRLNVVQIILPPLREQKEALDSAVQFIVDKYRAQYNLRDTDIDQSAWDFLMGYNWPGNFRELDNVLERALLLCDNGHVTPKDLPAAVQNRDGPGEVCLVGSFKERVAAFEKQIIMQAIQGAGGDRRLAAENLGIGLSTLYRKLEE